ncbi:hypothetical protein C7457_1221 [Thermovibrio guaymasensis]|uniref:Cytochrome c domain-containing protein n=1 Tax=Thermovibrio guaymasensis TaxID=240167 RepID=A0A420W6U6_9BACT|nr:hypothetical protein [Thermovibrio guaymasensis]RKQ61774.1 hypothetical protein C7457_1221 [Thermovibrio guaymasensis]
MKSFRWKRALTMSSTFLLALTAQAFSHPSVSLRDINGNEIADTLNENDCITVGGKRYCAGAPVSWEATCGYCHPKITGNVKGGVKSPGPIHSAYHVGRGWDELSDDFGAKRVLEGKDWRKFIRSFGDDGAW